MTPSLQLMHFDPVRAYQEDWQAGTQKRFIFYRAVNVKACDDKGLTMLAHAAKAGDRQAIAILLERGADPNAMDRYGWTPLMYVGKGPKNWEENPEGIEKAVTHLLQAGASLLPKDSVGRNAAFLAVEAMLYPFFVALDHCGVKPVGRLPDTGDTLLHVLCKNLEQYKTKPLDAELDALLIATILVKKLGVDPEAKTNIGKTARRFAVGSGSRIVAPWLRYGNSLFDKDEIGQAKKIAAGATPYEAASMRSLEKINALLMLGRVVDEPAVEGDYQGLTPLSCATRVLAVDVMEALVKAGSDPSARLNEKMRDGSLTEGTSAMRILLWAPQSRVHIPSNVTTADWIRALSLFVEKRGVANAPVDPEGRTPLLTLAHNIERGWWAGERLWALVATPILLMHGADPNCKMPLAGDPSPFNPIPGGSTPLGILAMHVGAPALDMAQLLLDAGADPNSTDAQGCTPLMYVVQSSSFSDAETFVEVLLAHGAKVTLHNNEGKTALDYASACGNTSVVEKLLGAMEQESQEDLSQRPMSVGNRDRDLKRRNDTEISTEEIRSNVTSFFDRIRAKTQSTLAKVRNAPKEKEIRCTKPSMPQGTPTVKAVPSMSERKSRASAFFTRMQSKASASQQRKRIFSQRSVVHQEPKKQRNKPLRINSKDLFGVVRGMKVFLQAVLPEGARSDWEVELLALGLFSDGGNQDPSVLARRTADLLLAWDIGVEVDWKTEGEDFCALVQGLKNYAPIRQAGFRTIPIDFRACEDVPAFVRAFDEVCTQWGFSVKLGELHLDSDSYFLLLLPTLQFEKVYQAAKRAGLTIYRARQMS